MTGNHSKGDAAHHPLIDITQAYQSALGESRRNDPILEGRRASIMEHLSGLDDKLRDVQENSKEVEALLYKMLQDSMIKLQDETLMKVKVILGEKLELNRQLQQMDWIQSLLNKSQDRLGQVEFLNVWSRHAKLRSDLHSFRYRRPVALDTVQADIKVVGSLEVVSGEYDSGNIGQNDISMHSSNRFVNN